MLMLRFPQRTKARIQITIVSTTAAQIQTSHAADGLPAAGVWVVVVPEESRRAEFRLYKSKTTDQRGNFELRGIAPGAYKVFSWDAVESKDREKEKKDDGQKTLFE